MYVYVYVHICYTCIYIYIYVCMSLSLSIYIYIYTYIRPTCCLMFHRKITIRSITAKTHKLVLTRGRDLADGLGTPDPCR